MLDEFTRKLSQPEIRAVYGDPDYNSIQIKKDQDANLEGYYRAKWATEGYTPQDIEEKITSWKDFRWWYEHFGPDGTFDHVVGAFAGFAAAAETYATVKAAYREGLTIERVENQLGGMGSRPTFQIHIPGTPTLGSRYGRGYSATIGKDGTLRFTLGLVEGPICFAAGTPLLTPTGSQPIEQLQPGDLILSRSEFDPDGPLESKPVEEAFVRVGMVWNLRTGGQSIRTTGEHPFYVLGKGWVNAAFLEVGDFLVSHDGQSTAVDGMEDSGDVETVYNLRVADFHTYFVGCQEWGFSVWAHNAEYVVQLHKGKWTLFAKGNPEPVKWGTTGEPRTFASQAEGNAALAKINNPAPTPYKKLPDDVKSRIGELEQPGAQKLHTHDLQPYKNNTHPKLPDGGDYVEIYITDKKGDSRRLIYDRKSKTTYYTPDHYSNWVIIPDAWTGTGPLGF